MLSFHSYVIREEKREQIDWVKALSDLCSISAVQPRVTDYYAFVTNVRIPCKAVFQRAPGIEKLVGRNLWRSRSLVPCLKYYCHRCQIMSAVTLSSYVLKTSKDRNLFIEPLFLCSPMRIFVLK